MSGRDTPPSIQDGAFGMEPGAISHFEEETGARAGGILDIQTAKKLGMECFEASTSWLNSGRRARWNDSLRAFQNLHPSGSKYNSGDYRYRSTMFRPKTRAMVRRDEATTAAAFFSNEDVVSITAADDDDPRQLASAEVLKALLQYRLADGDPEASIPWFLTLMGARQDAEVMGICVGKAEWEYEERFLRTDIRPRLDPTGMPIWDGETGEPETDSVDIFEKVKDRPTATLLAPENFRFEPGCDWRNPVMSSPYLIELIPVYIQEARERMESVRGTPAEWNRIADSALRGATDLSDDVTRRTRETGRVPGKDGDSWKPKDFDICWTRLNVVRWGGQDWVYRTLAGSGEILMPPKPIKEVWLHGSRPYVVGCVVLETHKTYPSSKVELTADLQRAANQDWNSRFDSVMLSLQPRQFVREGSGQDINDLRTFMPGKVVMVNGKAGEPLQNVITWDRPPPVDGAAFQEQDRINLDWDDLTGAFTNSSVQASQVNKQSATGMHLMSGEAAGIGEYELRLFSETWVLGMMRLFIKLEQAYETDPVILARAGKQAQLMQRFGINEIDDDLLNQSVTTKVNVGIGATNPGLKLKNFATGAEILGHIFGPSAAQGANFQEVSNEIFGLLGYKDGDRFFKPDFDPRIAMLQQELQKLQQKGGQKPDDGPMKLQATQAQVQGKLQEQQMKSATDEKVAMIDLQARQMEEQGETERAWLNYQRELQTMAAQPAPAPAAQPPAMQHPLLGQMPQGGMPPDGGMPGAMPPDGGMPPEDDMGFDMNMPQEGEMHPVYRNQMILAAAEAIKRENAMHDMVGNMEQGHQQMRGAVQEVVHTVGQMMQMLAQSLQEGNQQVAQSVGAGMQQLTQTLTEASQRSDENFARVAQTMDQRNAELMSAMTRKKKVVRGPDGRVAGVE